MSDPALLLEPIELIPVLALEPWNFARVGRSSPGSVSPEVFHEYWKASLADAGILGLSPVDVGSWFVPLEDITDATARLLVARWLEMFRDALDDALEGEQGLDGGAILRSRGETIVAPSCCSSLGDVHEWRRACKNPTPEWQMLYVGHPWMSVRGEDEHVVLSALHEGGTPIARHRVAASVLLGAVDRAVETLERFGARLLPIVREHLEEPRSTALARALAGLSSV